MRYNVKIPDIDNELMFAEVKYALRNFGNGVGIDGISSYIIHIFPQSLKEIMCNEKCILWRLSR